MTKDPNPPMFNMGYNPNDKPSMAGPPMLSMGENPNDSKGPMMMGMGGPMTMFMGLGGPMSMGGGNMQSEPYLDGPANVNTNP